MSSVLYQNDIDHRCGVTSLSDDLAAANNIVNLQLKKPKNWNWELSTSQSSPNICFPNIFLYDHNGKLLANANKPDCQIRSNPFRKPSIYQNKMQNENLKSSVGSTKPSQIKTSPTSSLNSTRKHLTVENPSNDNSAALIDKFKKSLQINGWNQCNEVKDKFTEKGIHSLKVIHSRSQSWNDNGQPSIELEQQPRIKYKKSSRAHSVNISELKIFLDDFKEKLQNNGINCKINQVNVGSKLNQQKNGTLRRSISINSDRSRNQSSERSQSKIPKLISATVNRRKSEVSVSITEEKQDEIPIIIYSEHGMVQRDLNAKEFIAVRDHYKKSLPKHQQPSKVGQVQRTSSNKIPNNAKINQKRGQNVNTNTDLIVNSPNRVEKIKINPSQNETDISDKVKKKDDIITLNAVRRSSSTTNLPTKETVQRKRYRRTKSDLRFSNSILERVREFQKRRSSSTDSQEVVKLQKCELTNNSATSIGNPQAIQIVTMEQPKKYILRKSNAGTLIVIEGEFDHPKYRKRPKETVPTNSRIQSLPLPQKAVIEETYSNDKSSESIKFLDADEANGNDDITLEQNYETNRYDNEIAKIDKLISKVIENQKDNGNSTVSGNVIEKENEFFNLSVISDDEAVDDEPVTVKCFNSIDCDEDDTDSKQNTTIGCKFNGKLFKNSSDDDDELDIETLTGGSFSSLETDSTNEYCCVGERYTTTFNQNHKRNLNHKRTEKEKPIISVIGLKRSKSSLERTSKKEFEGINEKVFIPNDTKNDGIKVIDSLNLDTVTCEKSIKNRQQKSSHGRKKFYKNCIKDWTESEESDSNSMGSNVSRHSNKGLDRRKAKSSDTLVNGTATWRSNGRNLTGYQQDNYLYDSHHRQHEYHLESMTDSNINEYDESCPSNSASELMSLPSQPSRTNSNRYYENWSMQSDCDKSDRCGQDRFKLPLERVNGDIICDQGYGSERSPEEDNYPKFIPSGSFRSQHSQYGYQSQEQMIHHPQSSNMMNNCNTVEQQYRRHEELEELFEGVVTKENTFTVKVLKGPQGLGISVSGGVDSTYSVYPGLIRIKRLFPHQAAWSTGMLQEGDIILKVNGVELTGLTNYEALEVLRTTPNEVELTICRTHNDDFKQPTSNTEPPKPPIRNHPNYLPLETLTPQSNNFTGEFEITLKKEDGSLGFTLRKEDDSVLGHYVRALVRKPATTDGRIKPGDKIIAVNNVLLSPLSHSEAVTFLRQAGEVVKLRLFRDLAQTPVALSPTTSESRSRKFLRPEAINLLTEMASNRCYMNNSDSSDTKTSTSNSNTLRRLKRNNKHQCVTGIVTQSDTETIDSKSSAQMQYVISSQESFSYSDTSIDSQSSNIQTDVSVIHNIKAKELGNKLNTDDTSNGKLEDNLSECDFCEVEDDDEPIETILLECKTENDYIRSSISSGLNGNYNPLRQSFRDNDDISIDGINNKEIKGLLKWKSVQLYSSDIEGINNSELDSSFLLSMHKTNADKTVNNIELEDIAKDKEIIKVELNRGWSSRLGVSLKSDPTDESRTLIGTIYQNTMAAKDGRLKVGDQILMINEMRVDRMPTTEIIKLIRIVKGTICITVARNRDTKPLKSIQNHRE